MNRAINLVLISICTASCAATAVQKDGVAEQLSYLIGPVSESRADFIGAMGIAECVANKSKAVIPKNNYSEFSIELEIHVTKIKKYIDTFQSGLADGLVYPEQSEKLDSYLTKLIPAVVACEKKVGVNVEF